MSMPDLAAILWRQRELLERLVYRLECEQLLLAAGRTRFLAQATSEVEALLEELHVVEVQRAAAADDVAREIGIEPGATLEELAGTAQPPWTEVLLEHRHALLSVTGELSALAETNKHLMSAGLKAVESTLAGLGLRHGTASLGYDAHGRTEMISAPGNAVVDRSL
ncbi:MAG: flagellar export chaperone FlgN [Kineosporiaceae bacterium]|jgi:flagellar biosynthesis/type III secretory pathway chaperone